MKKKCELCKNRGARMYCDSDQASLCWECDERVHSANFLVAKHSRNLLCHVCQSLTQWKASGSKFGPTFSVCQICYINNNNHNNAEGGGSGSSVRRDNHDEEDDETTADGRIGVDSDDDDDGYSDDSEEEDDDEMEEEEEEEVEEDGENQVVPWTTQPPPPSVSPSPPVATTSSSEIGSFYNTSRRDGAAAVDSDLKRFRENTFTPDSEDEDGCCSSQVNIAAGVSNNTHIIGRPVGLNQQRWDSEGKRTRRMDVTSSFMGFQER